ncbi:O-antigen ligase family protein [Peribacillus asahii]|uniref:O-antigen ligase family protein n=1 Tax=Peribacillus asahii TaxID=228899 RepID=UPI00381AFB2E
MGKFKYLFLSLIFSVILGVISANRPILFILVFLGILILMMYVRYMRGQIGIYHYVLTLIPLIIFSTPIKVASGLPAIRLDDLWLLFGAVIFSSNLLLRKQKIKFKWNWSVKLFLLFIFWIAVTILLLSFREPNYYTHSDWFEIVKVGKLLIIFLLVLNMKWNEMQFNKIANTVIISLFITAVFGIFQYFNIANINSWLSNYYIAETKISGFYNNGRVVGTFGNPNIFAGALIVGASLVMSKLMVKFKLSNTLILSAFVFAIFLTLSRTGLISLIVVFMSVVFFSFLRYKKRIRVLVFSFFLIPIGLLLLKYVPENFFMRIGNLNNVNNDDSFTTRLYNWRYIFEARTSNNIITGTGPSGRLMITFDNEWLNLLTYYGLIGVFLFVLLFLSILFKINTTEFKNNSWIQIAAQAMIVAFPIYMITSSVFYALQLMPIVMICLALAYRLSINERAE